MARKKGKGVDRREIHWEMAICIRVYKVLKCLFCPAEGVVCAAPVLKELPVVYV